jgi:hypothetical protein
MLHPILDEARIRRSTLPAPESRDERSRPNNLQLLQAPDGADLGRHVLIGISFPVAYADLARIHVAFGIQCNAARCEKLAASKTGTILAVEPRNALSVGVHNR